MFKFNSNRTGKNILTKDIRKIFPFLRAKSISEKPAFYKPLIFKINDIPTIVYPCGGVEEIFDRTEKGNIEKYLTKLFEKNEITKGDFNIIILWNEGKDIMSDVWIYDCEWESGALTDTKIFKNFELTTEMGTGAEDGLILLGREAEHRKKRKDIEDYINKKRPKLPGKLNPKKEFYKLSCFTKNSI